MTTRISLVLTFQYDFCVLLVADKNSNFDLISFVLPQSALLITKERFNKMN